MTPTQYAAALRQDSTVHYNCAQAVLIPFATEMGLTREQANALAAHFGSGMRHGATCGAVTGALMAMGLLGLDQTQTQAFLKTFQQENGALTCKELLAIGRERGEGGKPHCDAMVQCAAALVEKARQNVHG